MKKNTFVFALPGLVVLAALLGACAKKDAAVSSDVSAREPITVTWWQAMHVADRPDMYADDAPGWKALREATGVTIKWELIPNVNVTTAYNLLIASGDIPDIVTGDPNALLRRFIQAWLPLDTRIKGNPRYANLDNIIFHDDYLDNYLTDSDGHIRVIPMLTKRRVGDILIARQDLLEKYDIEPPVTLEDWHNALVLAKQDGKIPYMSRFQRRGLLARFFTGYMDCVQEDYFVEDGVVKYGALDPRLKATVEVARQWYAEGLIDQEYLSTDTSRWWENVLRGNVFAFHDNIARIQSADNDFITNQNVPYRVMGVGPMQSPYTGKRNTIIHYPHVLGLSASISVNTENPERVLDMFDYIFSEEGFILMNFGIEGLSFNYIDGNPVNDPEYNNRYDRGEVPHVGTTRNLAKNLRNELDYDYIFDREDHQALREARDLYRNNDFIRENWIASLNFTDDERSALSPINAELDTYRGEMLDKFIMGIEPMSRWDVFTNQIQGMNVDTALAIYQAALDRLLSGS